MRLRMYELDVPPLVSLEVVPCPSHPSRNRLRTSDSDIFSACSLFVTTSTSASSIVILQFSFLAISSMRSLLFLARLRYRASPIQVCTVTRAIKITHGKLEMRTTNQVESKS